MAENGVKHQKSNQINQPDKHGVFLITTMLTDLEHSANHHGKYFDECLNWNQLRTSC